MVKVQGPSDDEKLDRIIKEACERHGLGLQVVGWTRKTYDVHRKARTARDAGLIARIESFAMTSGEIRIYDDLALPFAEEVGAALETSFPTVGEAVIIREDKPV